MELDPLFISLFFGGVVLTGAMSLDSSLFKSTRLKTLGLFVVYLGILLFLYVPSICGVAFPNTWCSRVMAVREWISSWLGADLLAAIWLLSGFVGLNLELSGTKSRFWILVGVSCVAIFLILFVGVFGSELPSPIGPASWQIGIVMGIVYLVWKIIATRRRKPSEPVLR